MFRLKRSVIVSAPIGAVLFDLDNTLTNRDQAFAAWAQWFVRGRLCLTEAVEIDAALADLVALDRGGHAPKDAMFRALKERHAVVTEPIDSLVEAFREQLLARLPPLDPATGLLALLDGAHVPWGIVTNGSRSQALKIRKLGLADRAACVVISGVVGVRKPDPAIFRLAAEQVGVASDAALFVGDSPDADIAGTTGAGMRTAWLRRGRAWPAWLAAAPPDYLIDSLASLHHLLGFPQTK